MRRNVIKQIDTAALQHNVQQIKKLAPHSKIIAMIKANAYGHGSLLVARALPQVEALAVSHIEEALELRRAGIQQPILLMSSYLNTEQLQIASHENLQWIIHDAWQINLLQNTPLKKPLQVWLKLDTGMHRLGFPSEKAEAAWTALQQCPQVKKPFSVMTHFSCADETNKDTTLQQIKLFEQLTQTWPGERSLANSAGILAWPQSHADWVRPGIMLYGISPFADKTAAELGLKPVMRLKAPLLAIHDLKAGDSIGYGATYTCAEDMRVGVIGVGYGDGYPRCAPVGTPIYLEGHHVPLIGRVSMDMITVDLRALPHAKIGTEAILWGPELPIETIAQKTGVFVYELACKVSAISAA